MDARLLRVENLRVSLNGKKILRNLQIEIKPGEQWAIMGNAGSGKTVFAHTLAGKHFFEGLIEYPAKEENQQGFEVGVVEQQHRFRDLQNQSNFYYQQRYNAMDANNTTTVREELADFGDDVAEPLSKINLLEIFHLDQLQDKPLIQLSNGEHKRIQILKSVLKRPLILVLDEPFTGLDSVGRQILDRVLQSLSNAGQALILLSSRTHIPSCFNRIAILQSGGLTISSSREFHFEKEFRDPDMRVKPFPDRVQFSYPDFEYAVQMRNVQVHYEGRPVLENINWDIRRGERWSLTGPNGAGKSTLLSLIMADNPQAYANEIYLFDRRRGTGESIWDIKAKTGYLSPELHLYFDPGATAFSALASGLFDTIGLFRVLNQEQEELVLQWLSYMSCDQYTHRLLASLPLGIQRMILLGRALIKTPPLIVLDEPLQGLDEEQTAFALQTISRYCRQYHSSLIFVSHYAHEFPEGMDHFLRLEKGSIV